MAVTQANPPFRDKLFCTGIQIAHFKDPKRQQQVPNSLSCYLKLISVKEFNYSRKSPKSFKVNLNVGALTQTKHTSALQVPAYPQQKLY